MEVAIHLPDDVAAAVPWDDLPHHIIEQIALEGYQDGWLMKNKSDAYWGMKPGWRCMIFSKTMMSHCGIRCSISNRIVRCTVNLGSKCWLLLILPQLTT
jgi:hypothetical protein